MTLPQAVAAEVRAELARHKLSGVRAAKALGWTQYYISVRLRGAVPFGLNDLETIAKLLDVPVTSFFSSASVKTSSGKRFSLFRGPESAFRARRAELLGCAA